MNLALVGYGKMGHALSLKLKDDIKYIIDKDSEFESEMKIDIIIDFSNHESIYKINDYLKNHESKLIIGTTGYNDNELEIIKNIAKDHAVFMDSNYSIMILAMKKIIKLLNEYDTDYDPELLEIHSAKKYDCPSGTSKALSDMCNKNIKIHSIRKKDVCGIHELYYFGDNEYLEIRHEAFNRNPFVDGVIKAISFIKTKESGLYSMEDLYGRDYCAF